MKIGATLHGCDVKTREAFAKMDVAGYNYGILRYKKDLKKYPERIIVGSETFCNDAYRFYEFAKKIIVGSVEIGGGTSVKIQSMTTTKTSDVAATVRQIEALKEAGCEIVRVAVADEDDAAAVKAVKEKISLPLVADIHFSPKLAVAAIENGADKVRINPGNIGGEKEIKYVADCIRAHKISVRVGANTGSIEPHFLQKYGRSAEALVESALYNVGILEKFGVEDIVISVKASSVPLTVEAYTFLSERTSYPLHVGVTEAGTEEAGVIKSAVGIGSLLLRGIGDTSFANGRETKNTLSC